MTLCKVLKDFCIAGQNVRVFVQGESNMQSGHVFGARMVVDSATCVNLLTMPMYKKLMHLKVISVTGDNVHGKSTVVFFVKGEK